VPVHHVATGSAHTSPFARLDQYASIAAFALALVVSFCTRSECGCLNMEHEHCFMQAERGSVPALILVPVDACLATFSASPLPACSSTWA
jgi:hypothetical protein